MAAKTANILARVEPEVKEQAEEILAQLGVPTSVVINMLYKQIILRKGIPFPLTLVDVPVARDEISDEEFEKEMEFSIRQAESGETQLAKEVFAEIRRELK